MRISFDLHAYHELERQRLAADSDDVPIQWHLFVDNLVKDLSGQRVEAFTFCKTLLGRQTLFAWHPSSPIVWSALRQNLIYLSWGVPWESGLKQALLKMALSRSANLLVNEAVTREELTTILPQKDIFLMPFYIDPEWWSFSPHTNRESYLFCPGLNDRDPEVLIELARKGHLVIWLANKASEQEYNDKFENLRVVSGIPYLELRQYYQSCRAVILPLKEDRHAAGQTTSMEAMACGAPIYISSGRTSSIFAEQPSVEIIEDCEGEAIDFENCGYDTVGESAKWIRESLIPRCVERLSVVIVESTAKY